MPEWILDTRPPTVSPKRWQGMNTGQRHAAVKGYWRSLCQETRHMLGLKGRESIERGGI